MRHLEGEQQQSLTKSSARMMTKSSRVKGGDMSQLIDLLITREVKCPRFPPSFDITPVYTCRRRWQSNEAVAVSNYNFTLEDGHKQFLAVIGTSGLSRPIVECWRIKKISVWTINYVDNSTSAILRPLSTDIDTNNFNDREGVFICSSRSEAEPGKMSIVPARDTPLGSWHKTSTVNSSGSLFNFTIDNGGASSGNWATVTLDIEFEFVLNLVGAAAGYSTSSLTITNQGALYGTNLASNGLLLQGINVG